MALSFMLNGWEVFCQILAVEEMKSCGIDLENQIKKMEDNNLKTILPSLKIPCSLSIVSNAIETLDCSLVFYL